MSNFNPHVYNLEHRREIAYKVNLQAEVELLVQKLAVLINQVKSKFITVDDNNVTMTTHKEWYGKQLLSSDGSLTTGVLYFTVRNSTCLNKKYSSIELKPDLNGVLREVVNKSEVAEPLEYCFIVKQSDTIAVANSFVSASLRFIDYNNNTIPSILNTRFNLYGGIDVDSIIIFKSFVNSIIDQLNAFNADDDTLVLRGEAIDVPLQMYYGGGDL